MYRVHGCRYIGAVRDGHVRIGLLNGAAVFAVAASFVLGSTVVPVLVAEPAAAAAAADCSMLAVGDPCTFDYSQHPGETTITIPSNVPAVTVVLNGASGGGG